MVSFDDTTPIYIQIAEEIRSSILDGTLGEGSRLTSTTEYATRYRINPATANKAVALLVDEGLVVKRRGVGMFVADGAAESLRAERRTSYAEQVLAPALDAGLVLGLSPADLLDAATAHLVGAHPVNAGQAPMSSVSPPLADPPPGSTTPEPMTLTTATTAWRIFSPTPTRQEQS